LLILVTCAADLRGEGESGELSFPDTASKSASEPISRGATYSSEPYGIIGQAGFLGPPAYGRNDSIIPLELFFYNEIDNQILYGDLRGFLATNGKVGGNAGLGYRILTPGETALFGVSGWYDADNSTTQFFQQLSLGWEARMSMLGLFGNVYLPVGEKNKVISRSISNERFDTQQILFDVSSTTGQAMRGLDLYLNAYIPGDFAIDHQIQASAGWYHFQGGSADPINGFKLGLQGTVIPHVISQVAVSQDSTFGTNVTLGVFWRFGAQSLPGPNLREQMKRLADRNYNVIVSQHSSTAVGVPAINPITNAPYVVQQVGATGYASVADAQAAGADVIYVQGGTTLTENVVLTPNQYLLGEGTAHTLVDRNFGVFHVPTATTSTASPVLLNSPGDGLQLADHTTVSGFFIRGSGGRGIVANGIQDFNISNVAVQDATSDGIWIAGSSGTIKNATVDGGTGNGITLVGINDVVTFTNTHVENVTGHGVSINGGYGEMLFRGNLLIEQTGQSAFEVQNLQNLVVVDDKGTADTADDVTTTTYGTVAADTLVVRGANGVGGIELRNNEGQIALGAIDIQTNGGTSLFALNTDQLWINNGYLDAVNASAADVEGSGIDIALTNLTINGGPTGLRFVDTTGSFLVYGAGSAGSGGLVQNTTDAIVMQNGPTVGLQYINFVNNTRLANVDGGEALAIAVSNISGTTDMLVNAKNLGMLQIYGNTIVGTGLTGTSAIYYDADTAGSYTALVTNNTVTQMPGTFFRVHNSNGSDSSTLSYSFSGNTVALTSAGGIAAAFDWTGPAVAVANSNTITGNQSGQTAIQFHAGTSTSQSQLTASQNMITLAGANGLGIDVDSDAPLVMVANSNQIAFNGLNGTGIRIVAAAASGIAVQGNQIADFAGGATGILFTSIEDTSLLVVNANTIDLSRFNTYVDRGIILSAITANDGSTNPFVTFSSTSNNTVNGATTNFAYSFPSTPINGVQGQLIINGINVVP
jgi:hypothetical protein